MKLKERKIQQIKTSVQLFAKNMAGRLELSFQQQKVLERGILKQVSFCAGEMLEVEQEEQMIAVQPEATEDPEYRELARLTEEVSQILKEDYPGRMYSRVTINKFNRLEELKKKFNESKSK